MAAVPPSVANKSNVPFGGRRSPNMADESVKKIAHTMLNAGRGNPNWIATEPREAFFLLGQFGLCECRRAFSLEEGIAGIPQKAGIAARFEAFLKDNEKAPGANLLKEGYNYMLMEHAADPDTLVHEWAESVIGDQYPVPDRILYFTEQIVQDYLAQEMCDRRPPSVIIIRFGLSFFTILTIRAAVSGLSA